MAHRHYGLRVTKSPATGTGPASSGAWSGSAFIVAIVVIMIVLGVALYGIIKTVTDVAREIPYQ